MIRITHVIIAITITFFIIITGIFLAHTTKLDINLPINSSIWADYGTVLGGFCSAALSMASVYLIIRSIKEQAVNFEQEQANQKAQFQSTIDAQNLQLDKQSLYIEKQQIESRFFELLRIHRENINEITIGNQHGRQAFVALSLEFDTIFNIVSKTVETEFPEKNINLLEMIDITYLCFFFGINSKASNRILTFKFERYSVKGENFITKILQELSEAKTTGTQSINSSQRITKNVNHEILNGNQFILSHYLRHLHQTVKYINDKPAAVLSYKEKYGYMRTLRAQLSIQEQALLFFNALSQIGGTWGRKEGLNPNQDFITKYNLIKNIPKGYLDNYELFSYYPNLAFTEGNLSKDERKKFELDNFY